VVFYTSTVSVKVLKNRSSKTDRVVMGVYSGWDGAWGSLVVKGAALLIGRSRDRFPLVSLGIFSVVPPTEPCALRLTQPLKMSTRDLSWGKGGRCVWLMTYHPCSAETSRKSWALIYPEPLGPPRPVAGHLYLYFTVVGILSFIQRFRVQSFNLKEFISFCL